MDDELKVTLRHVTHRVHSAAAADDHASVGGTRLGRHSRWQPQCHRVIPRNLNKKDVGMSHA